MSAYRLVEHHYEDPDAVCPWDLDLPASECDLCCDRACVACKDPYDCTCDTDERHGN